jgi:hypothetical protein
MWVEIFIGTVQEKLRRDVAGERYLGNKTTYPFMRFLKVDSVDRFEAKQNGFL